MKSLFTGLRALPLAVALVLLPLASVSTVLAMGTTSPSPSGKDANYTDGEKAVKAKDYPKAIVLLERSLSEHPKDPDTLNYLGYSNRKIGQKDKALAYYNKALDIDPNHRGANEYLGELYLDMNDLPKAEERLARLSRICGPRCDEYKDLADDIAKFKAGQPRS
jgi:tetratricopeptide (TPR) repeat protein